MDDNGVVHLGELHAPSHILCDHTHEELLHVRHVKLQPATCLWCVIEYG